VAQPLAGTCDHTGGDNKIWALPTFEWVTCGVFHKESSEDREVSQGVLYPFSYATYPRSATTLFESPPFFARVIRTTVFCTSLCCLDISAALSQVLGNELSEPVLSLKQFTPDVNYRDVKLLYTLRVACRNY